MGVAGLIGMAIGTSVVVLLPTGFGIPGYIVPLAVITGSYAVLQAANNTAVMSTIRPEQRGVISGRLNLSRNLGLITGASLMGAVFAMGAATSDLLKAPPEAVVSGMRVTFGVAAALISLAFAIAFAGQAVSRRTSR